MKTFAKVTKNNNSVRLTLDHNVVFMLDMNLTKEDELWEIDIIRKVNKKQMQSEVGGTKHATST